MHFPDLRDLPFPVLIRRHPSLRRISLRVHPLKRCVVLNVPRRASMRQAIAFLRKKQEWAEQKLAACQLSVIASGMELVLLGEACILCHDPAHRGARLESGVLSLGGASEFMPRRLKHFLTHYAKKAFAEMVREKHHLHPELGNRKITVAVREMTSRWGSCTRKGRLCFNWRLIFAPPYVADYLVCHEMAHLLHVGHGARFWKQVEAMCPQREKAQAWLRTHGSSLYRLQF